MGEIIFTEENGYVSANVGDLTSFYPGEDVISLEGNYTIEQLKELIDEMKRRIVLEAVKTHYALEIENRESVSKDLKTNHAKNLWCEKHNTGKIYIVGSLASYCPLCQKEKTFTK